MSQLPVMDGIEATVRIVEAAREAGMVAYVAKPVQPGELPRG